MDDDETERIARRIHSRGRGQRLTLELYRHGHMNALRNTVDAEFNEGDGEVRVTPGVESDAAVRWHYQREARKIPWYRFWQRPSFNDYAKQQVFENRDMMRRMQ